jgi:hypothetical protein
MFWSPVVPVGFITENLSKHKDLELMINGDYTKQIKELEVLAKDLSHDTNNPFFRMLQILANLRESK